MRYRKACSSIVIEDGRWDPVREWHYRDGSAELYEYCADARTPRDIFSRFGNQPWLKIALDEFVDNYLMLFLDGRYLSLALPANPNFELEAGSPAVSPDAQRESVRADGSELVNIV